MKNLLGGNVLALIVITSLAATGPNQGIKHSLLCILLYTLTSQFVLICKLVPYVYIAQLCKESGLSWTNFSRRA